MDSNLGLKEEELYKLIVGWVKNGYPGRALLLEHVRYKYMATDRLHQSPRHPHEMVLSFGGIGQDYQSLDKIDIGANFKFFDQPWKNTLAPMPYQRRYHGIGIVENIVYVMGGYGLEGTQNSTLAFDSLNKVSYS